jgi:hypothetical protein
MQASVLSAHPTVATEIEGDWVWIKSNLKSYPEIRKSIKAMGFRYCKRGHPLPSGSVGTWANSCQHPTPTWHGSRKGKRKSTQTSPPPGAALLDDLRKLGIS